MRPVMKYGTGGATGKGETRVAAMQDAFRKTCSCVACYDNRLCCFTLQQATLVAGMISVVSVIYVQHAPSKSDTISVIYVQNAPSNVDSIFVQHAPSYLDTLNTIYA